MRQFIIHAGVTRREISQLTESDLGELVSVISRCKEGLPLDRAPSVDEMRVDTLEDDEFNPEGSWLLRVDGQLVGYSLAIIEANRLIAGLDDGYFEFEVLPEYRGAGLESTLADLACDYIKAKGVAKACTRCPKEEEWREKVLSSDGFKESYRVFILVRKGVQDVPSVPAPDDFRLVRRPYEECGDEELTRIVEAFNDSFRGHFRFAPERPERFIQFRDVNEDVLMFSLAMFGDDIVGVCLSEESFVYNRQNDVKSGWINILGVRESHRGKGVGRFLLADGMRWLRERHLDTLYIGVYAKNEKALRLYESVGFCREHENIWFEKGLR
jgi:ribosomal protein S18 acetylase RimI-like enzyme